MLYFLGYIPPSPLQKEIHQLKMDFKENYKSSHSLNAPPHITLISPFKIKNKDFEDILKRFAGHQTILNIELQDFSHFGQKVIFIDVKQTPDLMDFQKSLEEIIQENNDVFDFQSSRKNFHPHLTLAFKDLSLSNFKRAWEVYKDKEFKASFLVKELILFKHQEKVWDVFKVFNLSEKRF